MGTDRSARTAQHPAGPPSEPGTIVPGDRSATHSRRTVLRGAAVAGVAVPLLAACGSDSETEGGSQTSRPAGSGKSSAGGGKTESAPGGSGGSGAVLAKTSEVPEGGGLILADDGVVITQPKPGMFNGFSSTCTHQGCPVDNVTDGTINCVCHGSKFSIDDGSPVAGPAQSPLPEKPLIVAGNKISLG